MAFDLLDGDFYVNDPYTQYAHQREHEPVMWDPTNELWGVFRYDDIVDIERRKDLWTSADQTKGGYRPNIPADDSLIGLDDPMHTKRKNLVYRRFTPKAVSIYEERVREKVNFLLDAAIGKPDVEVIEELAAPLPAMMIGWLLGFGEHEWTDLKHWSEATIALGGGPRYHNEAGMNAFMAFVSRCLELIEEKKLNPSDDVMSLWLRSEVDGQPITAAQIVPDCLLLLDGGAETTRTVIARTLLDLAARPDQWDLLKQGADMTVATEEFIRWVTPIHNMCRVAKQDVEVGGVTVKQGEQVVLMYASANRDPKHFVDPERYDVTRNPNHHLSFGFGTHFCLGSSLARLEIRVFFEELVKRVARIEVVQGAPHVEMPNAFVYGLKEAHVRLIPG